MQSNYKWVDVLPKIFKKNNNTLHHTIQMKPYENRDVNSQICLNALVHLTHLLIVLLHYTNCKFEE